MWAGCKSRIEWNFSDILKTFLASRKFASFTPKYVTCNIAFCSKIHLSASLSLSFFLNSFLSLFLIPTSYTLSKKVKACTNYYKLFLFLLDFPQRALCLCTEAFNCSNTNSFPPCSPSIHYLDLFYQMRPHTIPLCSLLMLTSIILPSSNHWPVTKGPKSNILTIYYTTPVGKVIFCWSQWPKMRSYTRTRSMPPIRSKRLSILQ